MTLKRGSLPLRGYPMALFGRAFSLGDSPGEEASQVRLAFLEPLLKPDPRRAFLSLVSEVKSVPKEGFSGILSTLLEETLLQCDCTQEGVSPVKWALSSDQISKEPSYPGVLGLKKALKRGLLLPRGYPMTSSERALSLGEFLREEASQRKSSLLRKGAEESLPERSLVWKDGYSRRGWFSPWFRKKGCLLPLLGR